MPTKLMLWLSQAFMIELNQKLPVYQTPELALKNMHTQLKLK